MAKRSAAMYSSDGNPMNIVLTREQVRLVDRLAVERYGMSGLVLMENAGSSATQIIRDRYGEVGRVLICCGTGNNGGDGCVIARHLSNAGWSVRVLIAGDAARMTADTKTNYAIIVAMGLPIERAADHPRQQRSVQSIGPDDVVVDALLGTGFSGEVRSPMAELIEALNRAEKRAVVAIDVPSGLDCDTGEPSASTVRADLTITFVAEKKGFAATSANPYVGQIEVAGIGAPAHLVDEVLSART